ncbi:PmbA protein [Deinococcus metalli]|uniref:Peptidase n=1 Tax=Deinococcus metalli TaxID=1141878 RepID=A0A7W8KJ31_9DEIO|nr:TldD/PmbA family protein [Deinococcus metalli]MBB5377474.1 PmbA protein [Deinococcus metalli]GHF50701.1 peptidase [Deinococcus metalli]
MTAAEQLGIAGARTYLLDRARAQGIELEVYAERDTSTEITAFGGEVSEFKLQARQGLGLRALVAGAWGYAFTENLSRPALDRALDSAVENARLVTPQAGSALSDWPAPPALDLYGEGLSGVGVEQKVRSALTLEAAARGADPRVTSVPYSGYSDADSERLIGNTHGLERGEKALHAFTYVAPLVSEDGQNKMKGDWQFTREYTELDPTHTALSAVEKSVALLGAKPAPSGTFPAVITGECVGSLLALFAPMFSGKMVEEGKSPLAGRLDGVVASPLVTLLDDPTLPRGLNSRAFDAEGHPSAPLTVIEAGVLRAFMHNAQTAARAGTVSTGHAARHGYQGTVGVGHSNLLMLAGDTAPEQLAAGLTGVQLTGIAGGHAGADPITGDFSLQAEGFWLDGGQVAHPLEVYTVAGNILDVLRDVQAVGSEVEWTMHATAAPAVRVKALALGGS